ncbi:MAG: DUF3035 domain-containing protein [Paracoccus sp. (in: a-proteobacteria)]|uniref:DUF3035 domain-containing protein n=1 Tax=Paracoccus sp. TaxID=267 RepID=UPI0026DFEF15|nr:DUF3035 domain-containing protein [Paracoccus sp. (in: a-proteobacteria)]MDO5612644.1 DUF3035 domain-containing protein [Paracoccus sp. (in: a-proteobacteria)]
MRAFLLTLGIVAMAGLSGCSRDPNLMNLGAGQDGPDEFAILPTRQLSLPSDLNVLPPPTPGGSNITDPAPMGDAVAALGGNPAQLAAQGIGAGDAALVAYAGRGGTSPGIRQQLAQEDVAWRSANSRRLLETIARTNVYMRAYRPMMLDSQAEQERWGRAGARVPTAPPRP